MTIADIRKNAEAKMGKSIEAFKNELHKIRTGRAHPGILDQVQVDYYGSMVPISQVANLSRCSTRARSACSHGKRAWVRSLKKRSATAASA